MSSITPNIGLAVNTKLWVEETMGVLPAIVNAIAVNMTDGTNTISNNKELIQSNEIDGSKQTSASREGGSSATWPFSFDMRYGQALDNIIVASIGSPGWSYDVISTFTDLEANGNTITTTADNFSTLNITTGAKYSIKFDTDSSQNKDVTVTNVTANTLTVAENFDVAVSAQAGSITSFARSTTNGVATCSIGVEQEFVGIDDNKYVGLRGGVLNQLDLGKGVGEIDTVSGDFMGTYIPYYDTSVVTSFVDENETIQMASIDGEMNVSGVGQIAITSLQMSNPRNAQVKNRLFSRDPYTTVQDKLAMTLNVEAMMTDNAKAILFDNVDPDNPEKNKFEVVYKLADVNGNYYKFTFPFCKISELTRTAQSDSVTESYTLSAFKDQSEGYTVKVEAYGKPV